MAHFAKINNLGIVVFVTVGRDEDNGKELELSARTGDTYRQTSYNTRGGIHYQPNSSLELDILTMKLEMLLFLHKIIHLGY